MHCAERLGSRLAESVPLPTLPRLHTFTQVHTSRIATTQQMNNLRHYMAGARSYIESKQMDMSMPPVGVACGGENA